MALKAHGASSHLSLEEEVEQLAELDKCTLCFRLNAECGLPSLESANARHRPDFIQLPAIK